MAKNQKAEKKVASKVVIKEVLKKEGKLTQEKPSFVASPAPEGIEQASLLTPMNARIPVATMRAFKVFCAQQGIKMHIVVNDALLAIMEAAAASKTAKK